MDDSNVIPYEQYVKHCEESVVPNDASSAQDELHEYSAFPDESIHTRFKIQKDQLAWYEQCAKLELTDKERKMQSQMCTFITERNLREETLNEKIESLQKQLEHSVKQKQEIQESFQVSVQELKQNFKEKETKLEHDFSKLKDLKDKIEDKLYRQYNSVQAFNHIISHKRFSDVHAKNIIGDSSPTKSEKALEAQTALYDGNEMLKPMHAP